MHPNERRNEAAVNAGLRLLQAMNDGHIRMDGDRAMAIDDIASSGGELEPLTSEDIDDLCEALNLGTVGIVVKEVQA